jgi:hypothetical protein
VKPDSVLLEPLVLWEHKERSTATQSESAALSAEEVNKKVEEFARECGYISSVHATRQAPPLQRKAIPPLSSLLLRKFGDSLISLQLFQSLAAKGPTGWPGSRVSLGHRLTSSLSEAHTLCVRFSRTELPDLVRLAIYRDIEKRVQASGILKMVRKRAERKEGDSSLPPRKPTPM